MSQFVDSVDTLLTKFDELHREVLVLKELVKASVFLEQEPGKLSNRSNSEVVSSEPLVKKEKKTQNGTIL